MKATKIRPTVILLEWINNNNNNEAFTERFQRLKEHCSYVAERFESLRFKEKHATRYTHTQINSIKNINKYTYSYKA